MLRRESRGLKHSRSIKHTQLPLLFTILVLIFVILVLSFGKYKNGSFFSQLENQKWDSLDSLARLYPTVEFKNGTDLIWQIPDSPKAVLFLAHGCGGKAVNFWDKSPNCPNCVGLPEERLIVLHALARNFAVIAITSKGSCWSLGEERFAIRDIIRWWVDKQKLGKLPLFALGASSGGYFVSVLAIDIHFKSIALMIAEGVFSNLDITKDYPSTLFVHMPKDERRKMKIEKYLVSMREKGIDVVEIRCMEFPLWPQFFANRIPDINDDLSEKLFDLFKERGFIDNKGYMRDDGRAIPWKTALQERNILLPNKLLVNHIQEEMNLAYAYHEMTSLQTPRILDWFESHLN